MQKKTIRLATEKDSDSILKIYAPYITDTAITFEYKVPGPAEFKERMADIQKMYPWLVCEIDNKIAGYAYGSSFAKREAYKWSVQYSIYIDPKYQRRNIGKALYYALSEILKLQGFYNAYAGVALPNIKSESLHESFGFKTVAVYHNAGYKLGKWYDVGWYELKLKEHNQPPQEPKSIHEIDNTDEFKEILKRTEKMVKTD